MNQTDTDRKLHNLDCRIIKEYLSGRIIRPQDAPKCTCGATENTMNRITASQLNDWHPGYIKPPITECPVVKEYLAVLDGCESISIETFWHDVNEWRDADNNILQIAAWANIPMDGLDVAIRANKEGK